jgi:hypothetical protein
VYCVLLIRVVDLSTSPHHLERVVAHRLLL